MRKLKLQVQMTIDGFIAGNTQIFSFLENQTLTIPEITATNSRVVVCFNPVINCSKISFKIKFVLVKIIACYTYYFHLPAADDWGCAGSINSKQCIVTKKYIL